MKQIILLFTVFALLCTSCNSDDDAGSQDPIIGTWTYHQSFVDGVEEPLSNCEMQETFIFSSDGSVYYEYFEIIQGNCELEESVTGSWINNGNGNYTSIVEGSSSSQDVTFDGNTFYYEYSDAVDPLDPIFVTYREVFIKN